MVSFLFIFDRIPASLPCNIIPHENRIVTHGKRTAAATCRTVTARQPRGSRAVAACCRTAPHRIENASCGAALTIEIYNDP